MLRPLAGEPAGTRRRRMVRTVEQSAMRKVYLRILPFAVLTYFFCYLDRINVGFAALTMNKDLGLDAAIYGMAAGAFFWGYVLFEVPSNIILEKVGARLWIARIMITWGIISGATAFATGPYSFMAIRYGDTLSARTRRSGAFPRLCAVLHLLVPRPASRSHQLGLYFGAAGSGRDRRADLDGAAGARWAVGPQGMAVHVYIG